MKIIELTAENFKRLKARVGNADDGAVVIEDGQVSA